MAALIVKLGEHMISRHELEKTETTIGRAHDCDIVIDNPGISRVHAIVRSHGHWHSIHDSGASRNGIYHKDRLIRELRLAPEMEVTLGKYTLVFDAEGMAHEPSSILPRSKAPTRAENPFPTVVVRTMPHITARPPTKTRSPTSRRILWWLFLLAALLAALALYRMSRQS